MTPPGQAAIGSHVRLALRWALIAAFAAFVIQASAKAIFAAFDNDDFPDALALKLELMPLVFPVHMVTGALALVLLPLAFLLRRHPRWHRPVGRIGAALVLVSGLTAYPVALVEPVTQASGWGFATQASVWLCLLFAGIWNIRKGRVAAHRACMAMMLATTSGAIFFRVYLALWAIFAHGRKFDLFYAIDAWVAWLVPLIVTALLINRSEPYSG